MLTVKNLLVQYQGNENPSIQEVSFEVKKGEVVAVLGPSGCGKSTMLKFIMGLLKTNISKMDGEVLWNGKKEKFSKRMVFQKPTLIPWKTVKENIALGVENISKSGNEIDGKIQEILSKIGLMEYGEYYPYQLSVGMEQRVNFARALVCEPEVLLLDEPFSALDVNRRKKMQRIVLEIAKEKNMAVVLVTHSLEEALEMGDRILVFFDGKEVLRGFYENRFKSADKGSLYINIKDYLHAC